MSTWLVSSAGRRGALVDILRSSPVSGGSRVVAVDASPLSAAGRLADEFHIVPRVTEPDFVDTIRDVASSSGVTHIVPTIDPEIAVYANHKDAFAAIAVDVLVSDPPVAELSWDKWELHRWLTSHGFPTVATWEAGDPTQNIAGHVIAKPRNGSASIGVVTAGGADELDLDALPSDYIVQERVGGVEITVDFAVGRGGAFLGAVPRRRLEVRAGEVSKGVTVRAPEIEEVTREIADRLPGAYGLLNLQLFFEPTSRSLKVIELNARVGGGYPLSHKAGARFFDRLAEGSADEIDDWREDLVMLRFDESVFSTSDLYRLRE